MGLAKSRKPYPRSVLVIEDSLHGEIEIEGRRYRKVYKVTTYKAIQEHVWDNPQKYFPKGVYLTNSYSDAIPNVRAYATDKSALVVDIEIYEKLAGVRCLETPLTQGNPTEVSDSIAQFQSSTQEKLDTLNESIKSQAQAIERLSNEVAQLKAELARKPVLQPQSQYLGIIR